MDFLKSIAIAASGLRAQAGRMRVISENIANADSTARGTPNPICAVCFFAFRMPTLYAQPLSQHVGHVPQRTVGSQRLVRDDVEGGAAEVAGAERLDQGGLVDD